LPTHTSKETAAEKRQRVAREAATLLYSGQEKEYRQAKTKAAESLGARALPSNLEIALEMDHIAEETEGAFRHQRLIQMRTEALALMRQLKACCPLLIGSVWRGTVRRSSDIDIEVYCDEAEELAAKLKADGLKIQRTQRMATTERGQPESSLHVYALSQSGVPVEIVVRGSERKGKKRTCDTFGDTIDGLTLPELEKLLKENPTQKFLPQ
jgi:predicted nucleotidyltransferase